MAKNKKSFILYTENREIFEQLSNEQAGKLIKHIFKYVNDENPETDDLFINLAFTPIKQNLKRDLVNWEEKKNKYSEAGKVSAKSKRLQKGRQFYILEVSNNEESFIKVGITDESISRRFSSKDTFKGTDYKFKVIKQVFMENPIMLENAVLNEFKNSKYTPFNKFAGHTECFNILETNNVIQYSTTFNDVKKRSTFSTVNVNDNVNVNVNVKKSIEERKGEFYNSLLPYKNDYTKEMMRAFYEYWTEHGEKDKKFRKEKTRSFNVELRLKNWKKRESTFNRKNNPNNLTSSEAMKIKLGSKTLDEVLKEKTN